MLLVHGYGAAKEDFSHALDRLAERGWHAVAPDLRGHGESSGPDDEAAYSLDIFAGEILGLFDALGWERAVALGHSMGGMATQVAVLRAPERFEALVLMDTSHGTVQGIDPEVRALAVKVAREEGMEALADAMDAIGSPLDTPAWLELLERDPSQADYSRRKLLACSPHMYAAMATSLLAQDDRLERLRSLRIPTLLMVGETDDLFRSDCERMAEAIPGARLVVLPRGGHSPQFEVPDEWWSALLDFLDRL